MTVRKLNLSYLAGIIDARGHIELSTRHETLQPRVSVTTRRATLLEYLASVTGTQVSYDNTGYERKLCNTHCTDQHIHSVRQSAKWRVDSSRATIVLFAVKPYIISQKAEVREALRVGLKSYPAKRGDTAKQMEKLGWPLPPG